MANEFRPRRFFVLWRNLAKFGFIAACCALFTRSAFAQDREPSGLAIAAAIEEVVSDAIAQCEPSIVAIARVPATAGDTEKPTNPDFVARDFGSGVIIDADGLILTQYHVIKPGDEHWVTTSDRKVYKATIKGADPRSDLAVLAIDASNLKPIKLGDGGAVRKGQFVIALGNPYGIARDGQVSASWGIVSNFGRKAVPLGDGDLRKDKPTLHHFGTLIQTDARLNMGTSGGALVNLRGEMVGLITAAGATPGFEVSAGYAVPINGPFRRVLETLKQGREVEYGMLGVLRPENLAADEQSQGLPGMRIGEIAKGTPAEAARLAKGDVITHVDGEPIYGADGFFLEVGKLPADALVELTVLRGGRPQRIRAELTKMHPERGIVVTNFSPSWRGLRVDYASAVEEYPRRVGRGEIDLDGCVLVRDVAVDSLAWKEGVRPGMFISRVGAVRIHKPQEFYAAVADITGPVELQLFSPAAENPKRTIPPEL